MSDKKDLSFDEKVERKLSTNLAAEQKRQYKYNGEEYTLFTINNKVWGFQTRWGRGGSTYPSHDAAMSACKKAIDDVNKK